MTNNQQPLFAIEKIYVKDLSLEIPNAPMVFLERNQPEISVQLHTDGGGLSDGMYHVTLTVTVGDTTRNYVAAVNRHTGAFTAWTERALVPPPEGTLTVDGVVAAVRDDTRYALTRAEVLLTIETADGRFLQLTDGTGSYAPVTSETLQRGALAVDIREGKA